MNIHLGRREKGFLRFCLSTEGNALLESQHLKKKKLTKASTCLRNESLCPTGIKVTMLDMFV